MELFPAITGDIWKRQLANARLEKNLISEQIRMKLHPQNPTPEKENRNMVTYTKNEPTGQPAYYACFYNTALLGTIEMEVDGFYYFAPVLRGGFWAAWLMLDIAHKMDALNEAWNQKLSSLDVELKDSHKSPCTAWTPQTPPKK